MHAEPREIECGKEVHGECAERMNGLEQRIELIENGQSEIRDLLIQVASDAAHTRGRIDSLTAPQPPPSKRRRRGGIILNLGLGAGIVTLIDMVKDHLK